VLLMDTTGPDGARQAEDDFQRELAARRKDLEREFNDKARELKAQHQRRMDALRQEQADWEAVRRQRTKELADREEKLRKHEQKARDELASKETTRKELRTLKSQTGELAQSRDEAAAAKAELEARATNAETELRKARTLLALFAFVAIGGPVLWLLSGGLAADRAAVVVSAIALAMAVVLAIWWSRIRRAISPA
jgi:chromosome segregation ATPase